MADYWVSRDKYFCKYCKIYIADDKPSRLHHETGLRHKGNYERYIREVYRKGMQDKRDRVDEAKELARVEAAAAAAMGLPPPDTPSSSASSSKPKATAAGGLGAAADPYANYTTAASLGITDEAADRARQEAEKRRTEGRIGEWERVVRPARSSNGPQAAEGKGKGRAKEEGFVGAVVLGREAAAAAAAVGGIKREHGDEDKPSVGAISAELAPAPASASDDDEATNPLGAAKKRGFLAERTALGPDDDDDTEVAALLSGAAPIKLKKRRLTVKEQQAEDARLAAAEREAQAARVQARARTKERGAWESVEVGAPEPLLDFGAPAVEDDTGTGAGVGAGAAAAVGMGEGAAEDDKPKPAGGGFKKRKIPGAAARRK
ncbi:hypothetical protein JCM3770_000764 [Rhodotorula araucariae]